MAREPARSQVSEKHFPDTVWTLGLVVALTAFGAIASRRAKAPGGALRVAAAPPVAIDQ